jgi:hypothetical protein
MDGEKVNSENLPPIISEADWKRFDVFFWLHSFALSIVCVFAFSLLSEWLRHHCCGTAVPVLDFWNRLLESVLDAFVGILIFIAWAKWQVKKKQTISK